MPGPAGSGSLGGHGILIPQRIMQPENLENRDRARVRAPSARVVAIPPAISCMGNHAAGTDGLDEGRPNRCRSCGR